MSKGVQDESTNLDAPEEIPFSLTPGQAIIRVVEYWTKAGRLLYEYATENLNEDLFNSMPGEFYIFIQSLKVREDEYKRKYSVIGVLIIPGDYGTITLLNLNDPGNLYNSITNYCTIKLEDLTKYECTYVGDTIRRA